MVQDKRTKLKLHFLSLLFWLKIYLHKRSRKGLKQRTGVYFMRGCHHHLWLSASMFVENHMLFHIMGTYMAENPMII